MMRTYAKAGTLADERRVRLDALGFVWDPHEADWEIGYAHLVAYLTKHGHTRVPYLGKKSKDGSYPLGRWVSKQRLSSNAGTLAVKRREQLDALGFMWDPFDADWEEGYAHLAAYHAKHGHTRVPQLAMSVDGTYRLFRWVAHQRYTAKAATLSLEHRARLDTLGFAWDPHDAAWDEAYAHLAAYHAKHAHTRVRHGEMSLDGTYRLAQWVYHQRRYAVLGTLSSARRARLDALGFVWSVRG
jgi:hypothetical protein